MYLQIKLGRTYTYYTDRRQMAMERYSDLRLTVCRITPCHSDATHNRRVYLRTYCSGTNLTSLRDYCHVGVKVPRLGISTAAV